MISFPAEKVHYFQVSPLKMGVFITPKPFHTSTFPHIGNNFAFDILKNIKKTVHWIFIVIYSTFILLSLLV